MEASKKNHAFQENRDFSEVKKQSFPLVIKNWDEFLSNSKDDFVRIINTKTSYTNVSVNDFYFMKTLGKGSFGRVMLVQKKSTGQFYAAKLQKKRTIIKGSQLKAVQQEKLLLQALLFPFTISLNFFFQDNVYLYFIMPLMEGGEMFVHLRKKGRFDEHLSRFYAAQVLLALEYLHYLDVLYRDLKPENILLDREGYIKVADFGLSKRVKGRTYTLCGTPDYIAPEVLNSKGYGRSADYWSFGILLYELNAGIPPFYSKDPIKTYERITEGRYQSQTFFSNDLTDIIQNLLQLDLTRRYGNLRGGLNDIKEHKWFRKIIWLALVNKALKPPYIPEIVGEVDTSFFDVYPEKPLETSPVDLYAKEFADF